MPGKAPISPVAGLSSAVRVSAYLNPDKLTTGILERFSPTHLNALSNSRITIIFLEKQLCTPLIPMNPINIIMDSLYPMKSINFIMRKVCPKSVLKLQNQNVTTPFGQSI